MVIVIMAVINVFNSNAIILVSFKNVNVEKKVLIIKNFTNY